MEIVTTGLSMPHSPRWHDGAIWFTESGSGHLCRVDVADGSVQLLGSQLNGASEAQMVLLRRRLGFIFQAHNLHESLTALQNVRMGLEVHGLSGNAERYDQAAAHALGLV